MVIKHNALEFVLLFPDVRGKLAKVPPVNFDEILLLDIPALEQPFLVTHQL